MRWCAQLSKLHDVVSGLRGELRTALERARVAEAAQVAALTDKTWWLEARQQLTAGLQEAMASSQAEVAALQELSGRVQLALSVVQGHMLALPAPPPAPALCAEDAATAQRIDAATEAAGTPEAAVLGYGRATSLALAGRPPSAGSAPPRAPSSAAQGGLAAQDAHATRQVASDLADLSSRLAALVNKQADIREQIVAQMMVSDGRAGMRHARRATRLAQDRLAQLASVRGLRRVQRLERSQGTSTEVAKEVWKDTLAAVSVGTTT